MNADEWELARMNTNDVNKQPTPPPSRQPNSTELLQELLREQRETNRLLAKIGVMMRDDIARRKDERAAPKPAINASNSQGLPRVDLDSERGNFRVKKDPPKWDGNSFAGRLLSECSAEYLDELAKFYEWTIWKAGKTLETTPDDKSAKDTIKFNPARVAACNGWAERLRNAPAGDSDETQASDNAPDDAAPILG